MGASNRRSQNIHDNSRFFEFEGIQEWLHLADAAALGCCIVVVLLSQMDVWVIEFQQVFGVAVLFENAAIECQANLLNRKEYAENQAKSLEQRADSIADALRRAEALGQRANERLHKADAFGRQAKALRQRAKAL
ncbi:hypothetical protein Tco_0710783 [Tanacetum coccineum]